MKKIVTFGEIMLRLSTPEHKRITQAEMFHTTYGGGEFNVAASLACFGMNTFYVTKVPKNFVGQAAIRYIQRFGIHTDYIIKGGDRLGIYFLEAGVAHRPSRVVYDRAHSSISKVSPEEFDWAAILKGAAWFHWTGITPALSDNAVLCVKKACEEAKKQNAIVSCDLNYRNKLWSKDKANRVMTDLMQYVDVCVGNEEDASCVFGIEMAKSDVHSGEIVFAEYESIAKQLQDRFNFKYVAITLRESFSASRNGWSALIYDGKQCCKSTRYDIFPIVDRVGGGDSFVAGLIYSLLSDKSLQQTIEFAVAASCLKHTISGDCNLVTVDEVELLMGGDGSGRVQR